MLTAVGLTLLGLAIGAFFYSLGIGRFRRIPWGELLLLTGATIAGLAALVRQPGFPTAVAFALEALSLAAYSWYLVVGGRFPRDTLSLKQGDRFPSFTLPDSGGEPFRSESLVGTSSALYLFYRGDW